MQSLIEVILPVFLLIGFGYLAAWRKLFSDVAVDALMRFALAFAIPVLLFSAIARLDLGNSFNMPLMVAFYGGAFSGFVFAWAGARFIFGRSAQEAIVIGFAGTFSNSLLLGIPITERAYGADALVWNFAIISIHAPSIYGFGIIMMELTRAREQGLSPGRMLRQVFRMMFKNPLVIGIGAGFAVNISGVSLHGAIWSAVDMLSGAAIPAALFGLGGVLVRYRPEGDMRMIAWVCVASLLVHPGVTWLLASHVVMLDPAPLRSAVVAAAVSTGVNAYLFADMYGLAKRVAASTVLIGTALSLITVTGWLMVLG